MVKFTSRKRKSSCKAKKSRKTNQQRQISKKRKLNNPKKVSKQKETVSDYSEGSQEEEDDLLFDQVGDSDDTSSSEYDDIENGKKCKKMINDTPKRKYSRNNFKSCFNSFFKHLNCVPHPSSLQIDDDSKVKLQKQRQLIELDRILGRDTSDDELADLDDCLKLCEKAGETLSHKRKHRYHHHQKHQQHPHTEISKDPKQIQESFAQIPTGLEPVDGIIRQANACSEEPIVDLFEDQENDTTNNNNNNKKNTNDSESSDDIADLDVAQHSKSLAEGSDLISATSSFKALADEDTKYRPNMDDGMYSSLYDERSMYPKSSIKLSDYLTIDFPTSDKSTVRRTRTIFPYRFNGDNLNLSCLDDSDTEIEEPKHTRALNRRAVFYGSADAMVSGRHPISMRDFLN